MRHNGKLRIQVFSNNWAWGVSDHEQACADRESIARQSGMVFQNVSYVLSKLLQMSLSFANFSVILTFKML